MLSEAKHLAAQHEKRRFWSNFVDFPTGEARFFVASLLRMTPFAGKNR